MTAHVLSANKAIHTKMWTFIHTQRKKLILHSIHTTSRSPAITGEMLHYYRLPSLIPYEKFTRKWWKACTAELTLPIPKLNPLCHVPSRPYRPHSTSTARRPGRADSGAAPAPPPSLRPLLRQFLPATAVSPVLGTQSLYKHRYVLLGVLSNIQVVHRFRLSMM